MANTGVLPFVRGIDFSNNDFKVSTLYYCFVELLTVIYIDVYIYHKSFM